MQIFFLFLVFLLIPYCKKKEPSIQPSENKIFLYVKTNEGTYTYESASFDSETIDFLPQGTKVELVEITNEFGSLDELEGLWAKVFYNKFEGFVFLPHMRSFPPLEIDPKNDRIFSCITYSNWETNQDSIDYFILKKDNTAEHLWINEQVLRQGLEVQYFKGSYEETKTQVVIHSQKDYELYKYKDGFMLLLAEDWKKLVEDPILLEKVEQELSDNSSKFKQSLWVCQKTDKIILD